MNDQIQNKIIEWISNIENVMGEQIPLFVQEVANYGFYSNLFISVLFVIFIVVLIKIINFIYIEANKSEDLEFLYGVSLIPIFFVVFLTIFLVETSEKCIKALVAPKLYVIERFINK